MAVEKMKEQVQKIKPVSAITRELSPREDHVAAYLPTLPSLKPLSTDCNVNGSYQYLTCGEWAKTDAGENFLLEEDGQGDKIVIFSTVHTLELLAQKEDICRWGLSDLPQSYTRFLSACTQEWQTVTLSLLSSAWKIMHSLLESS